MGYLNWVYNWVFTYYQMISIPLLPLPQTAMMDWGWGVAVITHPVTSLFAIISCVLSHSNVLFKYNHCFFLSTPPKYFQIRFGFILLSHSCFLFLLLCLNSGLIAWSIKKERGKKMEEGRKRLEGQGEEEEDEKEEAMTQIMQWSESKWASLPRLDLWVTAIHTFLSVPTTLHSRTSTLSV